MCLFRFLSIARTSVRSAAALALRVVVCSLIAWIVSSAARAQEPPAVVINEIHYDPDDKTVPAEFLELYNAGDVPVDMSGWHLTDAIFFRFPEGTTIDPDSYRVVAEDPETVLSTFGVTALGPYDGRLANDGEEVTLRLPDGTVVDRVEYDVGFPWPLAPNGRGPSMELIHPSLDNDLAGSWRPAGPLRVGPPERIFLVGEADTAWHWRKGLSEASTPVSAWRQLDFVEDASWQVGQAPFGYGDDDDNTVLDDMQDNYVSVYLRRTFTIDSEAEIPQRLKMGMFVDDGAVAWINGVEVARFHVRTEDEEVDLETRVSSHEARWEESLLSAAPGLLRVGENILAVQAWNTTVRSSDFSIDASLFVPAAGEDVEARPTPGSRNSVFSIDAPPQIRQVEHLPQQPPSGVDLRVTAKITDPQGVNGVQLLYQVVPPGQYLPAFLPLPHTQLLGQPTQDRPPNPAFEDPANWTAILMRDNGEGGDAMAGDSIYTATIPGQENRTLVRYRIIAADLTGVSVQVPYEDDRSLNFAAWVYDGVPGYRVNTTVHPEGSGHVYPPELLESLPVYTVITRNSDWTQCIAYSSSFQIPKSNEEARDKFNWECAFVYEGIVYDHVRYRLRQANDRYGGAGKRSMRFRFNRGHRFQARDNYGKEFPEKWRTLNTGKMFDNKDVGNFGLTEAMNANLWNLMGVPSPWFYTYHMRVVDGPLEAPAGSTGQYTGDFFGMFSGIEDYDAVFLDSHDMEDGNLYKLKDGIFDANELRRNQGRFATTGQEDFQNIRANLRPQRDAAWLDAHVNYPKWYPYHAVVEGIRHYDFRPADSHSKNRAWYFEPDYSGSPWGRLWTLPWDSDASWGPNWNSGEDYTKAAIFNNGGKPDYKREYRNVIREFRDLVWTEEVIETMIDDLAAFVIEFSRADRDRYRGAPPSEGRQDFGTIQFKVADMKRFAFVGWSGSTGPTVPAGGRARHLDNLANAEGDISAIPATPTVTYIGEPGFPMDDLRFRTTPFSDPQGDDTFGALQWRMAEITPPGAPFDPTRQRKFEWETEWESGELTTFQEEVAIPLSAAKVGKTYRVRARMEDDSGRWGHWSDPVEFVVGGPLQTVPALAGLRITEIMYNPIGGQGFEFIELRNIGDAELDLSDIHLTDGVDFSFGQSDVTTLAPGEFVVVVENLALFAMRYDTSQINIAGQYSGRLDNAGEEIELTWGGNLDVLDFTYLDDWYPTTDGEGYSLRVFDVAAAPSSWSSPENWLPSSEIHGTPGRDDPVSLSAGLRVPGDANQDSRVDIGDAVSLLFLTFRPGGLSLPCEGESVVDGGNLALLDFNGDAVVDTSDAVGVLSYLFLEGPPHVLGVGCLRIEDCSSVPCFQ